MIILPKSHPNPIFGHSVDDFTAINATWTGINAYRNLTIPNGVTIQSDHMGYGPLIIKCSGVLRVGGHLHLDGKGTKYAAPSWVSNGGRVADWPEGLSSLCGCHNGNDSGADSAMALVCIGLGGAGGYGPGVTYPAGHSRPGWGSLVSGGAAEYHTPLLTRYECTPGEEAGEAGQSGGHVGGQDPADYIPSVLGFIGVGGGGAMGGQGTDQPAGGGSSGGSLIIIARQVIVDAGGKISANGEDGDDVASGDGGGGGGGSGGYIGIYTERYTNNGTVEAVGGTGGSSFTETGGDGGDSSPGCVKVERAA